MINNRRDNRRKKIRLITATKVKQKRVAIYCRVSTTSASQDESLEVQKSGLEKPLAREKLAEPSLFDSEI